MGDAAQLGTTSYVVLGLVSRRPSSGYDLAALAARSIANFWPISKSQVYAELARLELDGYILGTHVEQDKRPDKRRYELTSAGGEALAGWLGETGYVPERYRSGFLAKFFFAGQMAAEQRLAMLAQYRSEVAAYRVVLQGIVETLETRPESLYGRATALYGLINADAKIRWIDQMIELDAAHGQP